MTRPRLVHHAKNLHRRYREATPPRKRLVLVALLIIAVILPGIILSPTWQKYRRTESHLFLSTPYETLAPGQSFPLELKLSTGAQAVNAVSTVLTFDPLHLEILTMETEQSFCSFYMENSFDNMKGKVNIACGSPTPGFRGDSTILKLIMRVRNGGPTTVSAAMKDTMVLANDGKETNLVRTAPVLTLNPTLL